MRQPLVTIMRIARALIQCVMRTISGWMLTQRVSSIEAPLAALSPWSDTIAYTLQGSPPIAFAKTQERRREPSFERDRLEQFAHLRRAHQAVRLIGERQEPLLVLGGRALNHLGDAAVDQELRLARVSGQLEAARASSLGDRAEIDVAGDVLETREKERVGVRVVAVMAHERALAALGVVVLGPRKAVVDEQGHALFEHAREGVQEAARGEPDLGAKALGKCERFRRVEQLARDEAPRPVEAIAAHADAALLELPAPHADDVNRHRVQDLVADHDPGERGRKAVEPGHALEQVRHPRGERVAAALAQVCGQLEDQVAAWRASGALELLEQRRRKRAASRADLEHLVESGAEDLAHLARERLPVERRDLGRGDEVAALAELPRPGAVVAESGSV